MDTNTCDGSLVVSKRALVLFFKLVLSVLGITVAALAQIPVNPAIPDNLGVNIHFTDARPGEMEMLASTGLRWIRMDLIWGLTERERGKYDFSAYDRLMASLDKHKMRALMIFNGRNSLYDNGEFPHTDEAREAFARWAVAAARRYRGKGVLWEMWNEPNVKRKTSPSVEAYTKLALAVGKALQEAVPKEIYVGPATSLIDMPYLEACFKAGLLRYWSAVTVHPYRFQDPETVIPEYEELRALIAKYAPKGKVIPIIQGEWGWASMYSKETLLGWARMREGMNDELQGELLARQWLINIACGIPLSIWYDWHDDGPNPRNPEHNCGLVRYPYHEGQNPVYTPKPAYWAARTLTEVLKGYRFEKTLSAGRPGDYVLAFRKQRTTRLVAWTVASPGAISIPVEKGPCLVVGHKGESKGTLPVADGKVSLQLTSAPQYLVCGSAQNPAVVTN